jgi:hypothetical protein
VTDGRLLALRAGSPLVPAPRAFTDKSIVAQKLGSFFDALDPRVDIRNAQLLAHGDVADGNDCQLQRLPAVAKVLHVAVGLWMARVGVGDDAIMTTPLCM